MPVPWLSERFWISNAWRKVGILLSGNNYLIIVEDVGRFAVDSTGDHISLVEANSDADEQLLHEVAIGPVLLLALAIQDTWAFHASAVCIDDAAILFLGDSGAGKSTVARYLAEKVDNAQLVADDILPFNVHDDCLCALPQYPQLKLSSHEQPGAVLSAAIPVRAVISLSKASMTEVCCVDRPLTMIERAQILIHHSVATRLYDRLLMKRHLAAMAKAATLAPILWVKYPHSDDSLVQLTEIVLGL